MLNNDLNDYIKINLPFCDYEIKTINDNEYQEYHHTFRADTIFKVMAIVEAPLKDVFTLAVSLLIQNYVDYDDSLVLVLNDEMSVMRLDNRNDQTIVELLNQIEQNQTSNENLNNIELSDIDILILFKSHKYKQELFEPQRLIFDFSNIKTETLSLLYNTSIINSKYIELIAKNFETTLISICNNLNKKVKDLNFVSPEEIELLDKFNKTEKIYNNDQTIYDLFTSQVAQTPDQIALRFDEKKLTYAELFKISSDVACELEHILLNRKEPIGIYIKRSVEMIVAMLGIMKAGCAYVPLDPDYPDERIDYIIKQSQMKYVLTHNETNEKKLKNVNKLNIETLNFSNKRKLESSTRAKDLAYIIFTSGSTGTPKGVLIEHRNIVNTLQWRKDYYKLSTSDAVLQLPSFSFDSSVEDIFTTLISGATLVLIKNELRFNISSIQYYIENFHITHLMMLPSYYRVILPNIYSSFQGIRSITLAGEAVNKSLLEEHFKLLSDVNVYCECGPTEVSVCANAYEFNKDNIRILLGPPIDNVKCHVVNRMNRLAPIGGIGESWIESPGVARGFLGQVGSDRFVDKGEYEFNKSYRMYKSGDIVKWTYDGNIEFSGRRDNQVKVRGFRIELGEVEKYIFDSKCVDDVGVAINEDTLGDSCLEAFVVLKKDKTIKDLRKKLALKVPSYMIPNTFIEVDEIGKLPNGKIDRVNLEKKIGKETLLEEEEYSSIETTLHKIFSNVLNRKIYSSDEPLEYYGITSLQIIKAIYDLEKEIGCKLSITDIFQLRSIKRIVEFIETQNLDGYYTDIDKAIAELSLKLGLDVQILYDTLHDKYSLLINEKNSKREDEILDFIDKYIDKSIYPKNIVYTSKQDGIGTEAGLRDDIVDISAILTNLDLEIKQFNDNLLYSKEEKTFPLNGIQSGHIMIPNRYTGDIFIINNTVLLEKIKTTLINLINSQILLRSRPVYQNGEWYWQEYKMPEKLLIPFVDLSEFSESMMKSVIKELYNQLYFIDYNKRYKEERGFPYIFILIKRALGDYLLLFYSDHIIYDQVSFEVINKSLANFEVNQLDKDFCSYISILESSLISNNVNENELVDIFLMTQFSQYIIKCYKKISKLQKGEPTKYSIRLQYKDSNMDVLKNSLQIYSKIIAELTESDKIPVCMLNYGRKYGKNNYHNLIGEFVDIVPILVDIKNITDTLKKIQEEIYYLSNNSISLSTIIFNKKIRPLYKKFLKMFMPVSDIYTPNFLKFNFVGFKDLETDKLVRNMLDDPDQINYAQRNDGIVCEVFCLEKNEFLMEINTDYYIEESNIKKYIQDICKDEGLLIMEVRKC